MSNAPPCFVCFLLSAPLCLLARSPRLGLMDTNKDNLLIVAVTFAGYHAVKRHAGTLEIQNHLAILPMSTVDALSDIVCEAFWAASLVSNLKCEHYKPVHALQLTDKEPDVGGPDLELLHRVFFLDELFSDVANENAGPAAAAQSDPV